MLGENSSRVSWMGQLVWGDQNRAGLSTLMTFKINLRNTAGIDGAASQPQNRSCPARERRGAA